MTTVRHDVFSPQIQNTPIHHTGLNTTPTPSLINSQEKVYTYSYSKAHGHESENISIGKIDHMCYYDPLPEFEKKFVNEVISVC